tara:strand:- start:2 stop:1312 length:1311 start_codon:yes stop_codon:yes gene_type:complete
MNPFKTKFFAGKNDLGATDIYFRRIFYKGLALSTDGAPKLIIDEVKDLHFAEKALHGKINPSGNPILPDPGKLVKILDNDTEVYVLNFVSRAFDGFRETIQKAVRSGVLPSPDAHFKNIKATSGWHDATFAYATYLTNFKNFVIKYFDGLSIDKKRKIDDFHCFIDLFMEFYQSFSTSFPISANGFVLSSMVSNQSSGMMITIADLDFSSDEEKVKLFYNSPNFEFYKDAAIKNGFLIDKNAPWRLIADIDNPVMQSYINMQTGTSSFTRDNFFLTFFKSASNNDITNLQNIMANFFIEVVSKNRVDRKIELGLRGCFEITSRQRKTGTMSDIILNLSQKDWANLYLEIRNLEAKMGYSDHDLKIMARNVVDIQKKLDNGSYMGYINKRFSEIAFSEGSLNYKVAQSQVSENPKTTALSFREELREAVKLKKKTLY